MLLYGLCLPVPKPSVLQLLRLQPCLLCVLHLPADSCVYLEVLLDFPSTATWVPSLFALTNAVGFPLHTSASFMNVALSCSSFCIATATATVTTVLAAPSPTLSSSHPTICLLLKKLQAPQLRLSQTANHMASQTLPRKIGDGLRVKETQPTATENQVTASSPQPARDE